MMVDAKATLVPTADLSDDELTDLISTVIDYLDTCVIDPSVSTIRTESGVRIEISAIIDIEDPGLLLTSVSDSSRGTLL